MHVYDKAHKAGTIFVQKLAASLKSACNYLPRVCLDLVHEDWGAWILWQEDVSPEQILQVLRCVAASQRSSGCVGWRQVRARFSCNEAQFLQYAKILS